MLSENCTSGAILKSEIVSWPCGSTDQALFFRIFNGVQQSQSSKTDSKSLCSSDSPSASASASASASGSAITPTCFAAQEQWRVLDFGGLTIGKGELGW